MHQFFVGPNQIEDDTAIILGKDVNHIKYHKFKAYGILFFML